LKFLRAFLLLAVLLMISGVCELKAQDNWWKEKKYKTEEKRQKFANCKKVFVLIGEGLNYANVYALTPYFGTDVYLNILDNEKGYYSSDQTKYIIDNFLTNNAVYEFKWKLSSRSENYSFATGKYKYKRNGYLNNYDFSVSLKYINGGWLIDQIIIN
jgi:hypothetical protein